MVGGATCVEFGYLESETDGKRSALCIPGCHGNRWPQERRQRHGRLFMGGRRRRRVRAFCDGVHSGHNVIGTAFVPRSKRGQRLAPLCMLIAMSRRMLLCTEASNGSGDGAEGSHCLPKSLTTNPGGGRFVIHHLWSTVCESNEGFLSHDVPFAPPSC
jgi:hypothetical protein